VLWISYEQREHKNLLNWKHNNYIANKVMKMKTDKLSTAINTGIATTAEVINLEIHTCI